MFDNVKDNVQFSPFSLYLAMNVLRVGTSGNTLDQMNSKLFSHQVSEFVNAGKNIDEELYITRKAFNNTQINNVLFYYQEEDNITPESISQKFKSTVEKYYPDTSLIPSTKYIPYLANLTQGEDLEFKDYHQTYAFDHLHFKNTFEYEFEPDKTKAHQFALLDEYPVMGSWTVDMMEILSENLYYGEHTFEFFGPSPVSDNIDNIENLGDEDDSSGGSEGKSEKRSDEDLGHIKFSSVSLPYRNGLEKKHNYRLILLLPDKNKEMLMRNMEDVMINYSLEYPGDDFVSYIKRNQMVLKDMDSCDGCEDGASTVSKSVQKHYVHLKVPKFHMEHKTAIKKHLTTFGIMDIFDPEKAEITEIFNSSNSGPYVNDFIHLSKIQIDERGTFAETIQSFNRSILAQKDVIEEEAAASNGKIRSHDNVHIKTFYCHRPFIYILVEENSNMILFMGKVLKPSRSARKKPDVYIASYMTLWPVGKIIAIVMSPILSICGCCVLTVFCWMVIYLRRKIKKGKMANYSSELMEDASDFFIDCEATISTSVVEDDFVMIDKHICKVDDDEENDVQKSDGREVV